MLPEGRLVDAAPGTAGCRRTRCASRRPRRPGGSRPSRRRSSSPGAGCRRTCRTCRSARTAISRIAKISSQLVSGVGFSNGWAELALKKPPPLLPISLIHSWEAIGPDGDVLRRALEGRDDLRRVPGLRNALPDEDQRADDGDRQQDVEHAAGQVDPVVAERLGAAAGQAADQRDRDGEARGGRGEVADGEDDRSGSGTSRPSRRSSSASWCSSRR